MKIKFINQHDTNQNKASLLELLMKSQYFST